MKRIYADYNATTPLDLAVLEAMLPHLRWNFGNPSSIHHEGRLARVALDEARSQMAAILGAQESEITFTGGGTEADNMVICGVKRGHIITSMVEHHAVLHACRHRPDCEFTYLPVDRDGLVAMDDLHKAIRPDTVLVSIMAVNNETGVIQPVKELADICRERGVLFHTDAVQAFGKLSVNVVDWGVDMLSISAHKFYGPKGVGALYLRRGVKLTPLLVGGAHENERRAGTENVAGIVGMAKAAELAVGGMADEQPRLFALTEKLATGIQQRITGAHRNGHATRRIAGTVNFSFEGCEDGSLVPGLDLEGVAVSSGSACAAGAVEPSHVLAAMGLPVGLARSAVRFSLGAGSTEEDVTRILEVLPKVVTQTRAVRSRR